MLKEYFLSEHILSYVQISKYSWARFKLTGVKIPKIGKLHFPAKISSEKLKICKDDLALWQVEGSPGLPDIREKINWKILNLQFFRRIFRGELHISQGIFGIRVYENPCVKYSSFILCCVPVRSFTRKISLSRSTPYHLDRWCTMRLHSTLDFQTVVYEIRYFNIIILPIGIRKCST